MHTEDLYEKSKTKAAAASGGSELKSLTKTVEEEENEVNKMVNAKMEAEKAEDQLAMGREGETIHSEDEHEHQFTIEAPPIHQSIYDSDNELKKNSSSLPAVVSQVVPPAQGVPQLDQPPKPTPPPLTKKQSSDAMKKVKGWLW